MQLFVTRRVDELGRIVLPMEIRRRLQIEADTPLDICLDNSGKIVLQKSKPFCKICGVDIGLTEVAGKSVFVCTICRQAIHETPPC